MIISVPPRNKRKRRQRWIIAQSKTIKSDFEVFALPNLWIHLLQKWRSGLSRQAPLDRCVLGRGVGPSYCSTAGLLSGCWGHCCVFPPTENCSRLPEPTAQPRAVPWSLPCIQTSWVWVRSGKHSCSHIICNWLLFLQPTDHLVNKHDMKGGEKSLFSWTAHILHGWFCSPLILLCP